MAIATTPAAELRTEPLMLSGADGLPLAATRFIPADIEDGMPLLFAHGFGQTRAAWQRSALALAARGHAGLGYDARGHGQSGRNPAGLAYEAEQFAGDMIAAAQAQDAPPVLVGASMGGLFGLVSEALQPGLFRALVLVDVTPRWEAKGFERIMAFMSAFPHGFDSLQHAGDIIAAYLPQRRERKSDADLRGLLRQGDDGRWRWHWDARLLGELASGFESHQQQLVDAARQVRCPVLLVSGGKSDLVSQHTIDEFRVLVPHARHVQLADATHMLAGDDNDAFTAAVLDYLSSLQSVAA